eukprot:9173698-Lingulodinium_polyedra.AAC.1
MAPSQPPASKKTSANCNGTRVAVARGLGGRLKQLARGGGRQHGLPRPAGARGRAILVLLVALAPRV